MALFQKPVLNKYLKLQDAQAIEKAYKKFVSYFHNAERQQNIRESKEEQFQEGFLRELFVNVLDYTLNPEPNFNLTTELKNEKGAKKADGAILKDGQAIAVIELKSTKTKDLESIRQQAFDYKANQTGCVYVVTSNFEKLRFYVNNAVEFEAFNLFNLTLDRFALLYLCLHQSNVHTHKALEIKTASIREEENITKQFYADYSIFKRELYRDLVKLNIKNEVFRSELTKEDIDRATKNIKLTLFKKSQKLIDRFLFIFFGEDRGLLPPNSTIKILEQWNKLKELDEIVPLYSRFIKYFNYLDKGRKGTDKTAEIYAYNGGLFKPDPVLDSLLISDELLYKHTKGLSLYNFDSQIDVNILGHIFENSLNEIESVNAEIEGVDFDKQTTKRKKDGVFYTPKYITKYIVDNTVGKLCTEKKEALKIIEGDFNPKRTKETKKKLLSVLKAYRDWLLTLTILDPACGSGAFLNQALDFLIKEHQYIDELDASLTGQAIVFRNIENTVLENNIYGVDLNEESVEIAKLSLWLRTAQPRRQLTTLSSNIKCGNSLIDDPKVAGDKAFNWQIEFAHVFKEKDKKAFHITTATHDSRTSQRMIDHKVRLKRDGGTRPKAAPIWMKAEDELLITETIASIIKEDGLNVMAYNICGDHMHLLLVCEEEEVTKIVGKIKAISSKEYNTSKGITTRGHVPLAKEESKTYNSLWTQKFGNNPIKDEKQLWNTIEYIQTNREKHELPPHGGSDSAKGTCPLGEIINDFCCSYEHAFRTEHAGGFDVVIGNPPYVHLEAIKDESEKLSKLGYFTFDKRGDLYPLFVEKGINILKEKGVISYIMPNKWLQAGYGKNLREYFLTKQLIQLIDFGDIQIFQGATTYPCIFIANNDKPATDFSVSVLKSTNSFDFDTIVSSTAENFETAEFSGDIWVISSKKEKDLLKRLSNEQNSLSEFINDKFYYGLKTGLSEAFLIDESTKNIIIQADTKASNFIHSFLQGRDVQPYVSPEAYNYLLLFEKGFTKRQLGDCTEEQGWEWLEKTYPSIAMWLSPFEEKGKKRTDKGDFWWEVRACDYYTEFHKPKIMYQTFQVKPCFIYDESGLLCNNSMWIIPTDNKALVAVLNSKMGWWLITKYCTQIQNGCQLIWKYFGQIPIPELSNPNLLESTELMLELQKKQQSALSKFITYLQSQFNIEKLSKKLQNWHELAFAEFITELNKAIKKHNKEVATATQQGDMSPCLVEPLTKSQEMDWMEVFETKKAEAQTLKAKIDKTDAEIDAMVYKLYGLSDEEIKIVENS